MSTPLSADESALLSLFRRTNDGGRVLSCLSLAATLKATGSLRSVDEVAASLVRKNMLRPVGDLNPGQPPGAYALTSSARSPTGL
ncbi:hypothetical protein [Oleisolibacter albus]|uniref:hypothetical protein n=1 Tax=Oleisolibacter albus TaxID=2171757 RepID=UPI000DF41F2C|nr:hypothetical protein [Oleisolibacter albus]